MQRATLAISCLALFVALGGPSQAQKITSALSRDEVRTQHIRNGHVISGDLKDGAVKSIDLKDGTVAAVDVAPDSIGPVQIANQSLGAFEIEDHDLGAEDIAEASGSDSHDFGAIGAGDCQFTFVNTAGTEAGDQPIATPMSGYNPQDEPLVLYATGSGQAHGFRLVACNISGASINPDPISFRYVVIDQT